MSLSREDLELRKSGIGGSEVAACLGLSKWSHPAEVWLRKTSDEIENSDFDDNLPAEIGTYMEPKIAEIYQRRLGGRVACPMIGPFPSKRHIDRPWQIFSPDRLVLKKGAHVALPNVIPAPDKIDRVLEIKTAGPWTKADWGRESTDEIPFDYLCQVAWYMSAMDVDATDIAVIFSGNQYARYHVARDKALEDHLLEQVEKFWTNHIVKNNPPEPDGSSTFSRYLRDRWDKSIEKTVPESEELNVIALELRDIRIKAKAIEDRKNLLEQKLQNVIGNYDSIETSIGKITWRFDSKGRVSYKDAAEALAIEVGLDPHKYQNFLEAHRSKPARKFTVPRAWNKKDESQ